MNIERNGNGSDSSREGLLQLARREMIDNNPIITAALSGAAVTFEDIEQKDYPCGLPAFDPVNN